MHKRLLLVLIFILSVSLSGFSQVVVGGENEQLIEAVVEAHTAGRHAAVIFLDPHVRP